MTREDLHLVCWEYVWSWPSELSEAKV
jgi:hypothetical protein